MKLSFSLSSSKPPKPSLKPSSSSSSQTTTTNKEFVTEFDPSQPPTNHTQNIIPPIANEWTPHKKIKNLNIPNKSDDPNLQFEVVNSNIEEIDSNISYGLNIRSKKSSEPDSNPKGAKFDPGSSSIDQLMLNKLRSDLGSLPDHRGMDEFEEMPVESFAAALLKGYGWEEGKGVGKNAKEDVKVFEFRKRTGKEGLGFVNDIPVPPSKDSKKRASNLKETEGNERVHSGDRRKDSSGSRDHKKMSGKRRREKERESERERYETSSGSLNSKRWLSSHIRVRIISKELKGGRLYLKKGEIVDVVGPTSCDIRMDDGRELIQGVDEAFLETALPRRGGPVLVLCGRYKGVYGCLQEKDMDKETAVVRDADTHGLINVKLEQIAEYVGDPDDIGY